MTSRRIKHNRIDPADKLGRSIDIPDAQLGKGDFIVRDVANHSEADQRASVRGKKTETVRRLTRIDKLLKRGVIGTREALACEWYHNAHSARYDTTGVTAKYGESSGGGCTNFDHLPKTREQRDAFDNFTDARASISPAFLPMFERIVLQGRPLGKLAITFRTVASRLLEYIESRVSL